MASTTSRSSNLSQWAGRTYNSKKVKYILSTAFQAARLTALKREARRAVERYSFIVEPIKGGYIGWSPSFEIWMIEQPTQLAALVVTRQKMYQEIMRLLEKNLELPDPMIERSRLIIFRSQTEE